MTIEIRCSPDRFDIRDYAYRDTLHKLCLEKGQDLKYGIFNYDRQNKNSVHVLLNLGSFYKYEIFLKNALDLQQEKLNPQSVLIPLNFQKLSEIPKSCNPNGPFHLLLGTGFTEYEIDKIYLPPVEQQAPGQLCVANAGVALLEYFERVAEGRHRNASRLFLHQVACKLLHIPPTSAPSIRSIVKALTRFGAPPEEYWPYDLNNLEKEPDAFCYAYAKDYRAESYHRLDRPDMDKDALVAQIKIFVYCGFPVICRFSIHDSIEQADESIKQADKIGKIPIPTFGECSQSDHAVVIVGYDDTMEIVNDNPIGERDDRNSSSTQESCEYGKINLNNEEKIQTIGAFKIRNSWGKEWGEKGYGWLPYAYIHQYLAGDFWSIAKFEWNNAARVGLSGDRDNNFVICRKESEKHCNT